MPLYRRAGQYFRIPRAEGDFLAHQGAHHVHRGAPALHHPGRRPHRRHGKRRSGGDRYIRGADGEKGKVLRAEEPERYELPRSGGRAERLTIAADPAKKINLQECARRNRRAHRCFRAQRPFAASASSRKKRPRAAAFHDTVIRNITTKRCGNVRTNFTRTARIGLLSKV